MEQRISVVMAVYNGRKYIEEQIKSIVEQTKKVDEIIIVDDCSKESCKDLIMNCLRNTDMKTVFQEHTHNRGYAQTFFEALSYATGDYIFISDQDDVWEANKVETSLRVMRETPNITCLSSLNKLIDAKGEVIRSEDEREEYLHCVSCEELIKQTALRPGMSLVITKALLETVNRTDKKNFEQHDRLIEYLAALEKGFYILNEHLTKYRIHGGNTSGLNLSHFKPRADRMGRIKQINTEVKYLELIKPLGKENLQLIERCAEYYLFRKQLLEDRKLLRYVFSSVEKWGEYPNARIWLGDILSIIRG